MFSKIWKGSSLGLGKTFKSSDGSEGPAGTARALVFDWSDSAFGSPVDGVIWDGSFVVLEEVGSVLALWSDGTGVEGGEFLGGEVRELVETELVGLVLLGVVFLDEEVVFSEDVVSLATFERAVKFGVVLLPLLPDSSDWVNSQEVGGFSVEDAEDGSNTEEGDNSNDCGFLVHF